MTTEDDEYDENGDLIHFRRKFGYNKADELDLMESGYSPVCNHSPMNLTTVCFVQNTHCYGYQEIKLRDESDRLLLMTAKMKKNRAEIFLGTQNHNEEGAVPEFVLERSNIYNNVLFLKPRVCEDCSAKNRKCSRATYNQSLAVILFVNRNDEEGCGIEERLELAIGIPSLSNHRNPVVWCPRQPYNITEKIIQDGPHPVDKISWFETPVRPYLRQWEKKLGLIKSNRNFCVEDKRKASVVQFGKVDGREGDTESFEVSFGNPLSRVQAFALVCAGFMGDPAYC